MLHHRIERGDVGAAQTVNYWGEQTQQSLYLQSSLTITTQTFARAMLDHMDRAQWVGGHAHTGLEDDVGTHPGPVHQTHVGEPDRFEQRLRHQAWRLQI